MDRRSILPLFAATPKETASMLELIQQNWAVIVLMLAMVVMHLGHGRGHGK